MGKRRKKNPASREDAISRPKARQSPLAGTPAPKLPAGSDSRWTIFAVCVFLAATVWIVFGQTLHFEFINYDDDVYVYENPEIVRGLSWHGIAWIFTHTVVFNWHPLTMLSHMLDCQFYGLHAGGHHLTNVLLHTTAVILLFLVLREMTGALWRSAFVAAVFAIHPLRVESVAWVAERKDVLSGVFFMLTLWAYLRHVRNPKSPMRYMAVAILFALGLMSKPMLVTLPFVLLLLDYWPLGRFENPNHLPEFFSIPRHLLLEKIPLLVLAAADCVVTVLSQHGAIVPSKSLPPTPRLENAALSCVIYLKQMFYPARLAVFYPYASNGPMFWKSVLAFLLLAAITAVVFVWRKKRPFMLVGWLWYLGMLVPVIGLVQVGQQSHADRYTYLPQIGLYLMLAWAAADICAGWRHRRVVLGGIGAFILAVLIFCARTQTSQWKNSETIWTHALACTSNNHIAHDCLGKALLQDGEVNEAIAQCQMALDIVPDYAEARYNLGNALFQKGEVDEAIAQWHEALEFKPGYAEAYHNLGVALLQRGQVNEAIAQWRKELETKPDDAEVHYSLGVALFQQGQVNEAIAQWQTALEINPDYAEVRDNLGVALAENGKVDEAILQFQKSLEINPDNAEACNNLGMALVQKGRLDEASAQFRKALEIKPGFAPAQTNLDKTLLQEKQE